MYGRCTISCNKIVYYLLLYILLYVNRANCNRCLVTSIRTRISSSPVICHITILSRFPELLECMRLSRSRQSRMKVVDTMKSYKRLEPSVQNLTPINPHFCPQRLGEFPNQRCPSFSFDEAAIGADDHSLLRSTQHNIYPPNFFQKT